MEPFLTLPRIHFHRREQDQREGQGWWKSSQDWRGVLRSGRFPISLGKSREVQGGWGIALSFADKGNFFNGRKLWYFAHSGPDPQIIMSPELPSRKTRSTIKLITWEEDFLIISLLLNLILPTLRVSWWNFETSDCPSWNSLWLSVCPGSIDTSTYMWLLLQNERH